MAAPWRGTLGIPLRKGDDGADVRPIIIGDAFLSLPGACLPEITQHKAAQLFSDTHLGLGTPAGPETLLYIGKALSKLCPDDVLCALDVHNAFGEISRAESWRRCSRSCQS